MKTAVLCFMIVIFGSSAFAQEKEGDIVVKKVFGGIKLSQDGRVLKPKEVLAIMQPNEEAYAEFKKAKSNYDGAQVMGFIGGALIGWPLGTALAGGDPQWGLVAGGVGILLLSIPLNTGYTSHAKNAVEIYNHGSVTSSTRPYSLQLVPYGTGARLILKF